MHASNERMPNATLPAFRNKREKAYTRYSKILCCIVVCFFLGSLVGSWIWIGLVLVAISGSVDTEDIDGGMLDILEKMWLGNIKIIKLLKGMTMT